VNGNCAHHSESVSRLSQEITQFSSFKDVSRAKKAKGQRRSGWGEEARKEKRKKEKQQQRINHFL
jgi:hypothetical protein